MPRNSTGQYTLPAGNPVIPDTLIETEWANPTLSDIAQALSDSLDRNGRGNMLAPMKFADGSVSAPSISFASENSTGIFHPGARAVAVSVFGTEAARFTDAAFTLSVPQWLTDGTAAAPALAFASEANTGLYHPMPAALAVSVAGADCLLLHAGGANLTGNLVASGTLSALALGVSGAVSAGGPVIVPPGALAVPTLTFSGDTDTGIYSPAPGVVALVTDGVERARWDASGSSLLPAGIMADYGGAVAPAGWLLCDGQAYSRTTYAALYAALGGAASPWGQGDGATTFNVPDLRRRVAVGAGGAASATLGASVGAVGGAETITLTVANMPAHAHAVTDPGHNHTITDPGHAHAYFHSTNAPNNAAGSIPDHIGETLESTGAATTGITIQNKVTGITIADAGGGAAFDQFQPSAVVTKIIKV